MDINKTTPEDKKIFLEAKRSYSRVSIGCDGYIGLLSDLGPRAGLSASSTAISVIIF